MTIKQGIVLCKRTGELVGFEDNIAGKLNQNLEDLLEGEGGHDQSDNDSCEDSDYYNSDVSSEDQSDDLHSEEHPVHNKKAKFICQFFFSSLEGHLTWPVAAFPSNKVNHKVLASIFWKVCETLGSLNVDDEP